jgi:hypothetical protein
MSSPIDDTPNTTDNDDDNSLYDAEYFDNINNTDEKQNTHTTSDDFNQKSEDFFVDDETTADSQHISPPVIEDVEKSAPSPAEFPEDFDDPFASTIEVNEDVAPKPDITPPIEASSDDVENSSDDEKKELPLLPDEEDIKETRKSTEYIPPPEATHIESPVIPDPIPKGGTSDTYKTLSAQQRYYDIATFQLLNPNHPDTSQRSFVQCNNCEGLYLVTSWEHHHFCLRCNGSSVTPVSISPPPDLVPQSKKIIPLDISREYDLTKEPQQQEQVIPKFSFRPDVILQKLRGSVKNLGLLARNMLVALILIVLVGFVGANGYRIKELDEITLTSVLDTLLRAEESVSGRAFLASFGTAFLVAFALYPKNIRVPYSGSAFFRRLMRIVGVLVCTGIFTVLLQEWDVVPFDRFMEMLDEFINYEYWDGYWEHNELFVIQIAAIGLTIVSAPIYRQFSKESTNPPPSSSNKFRKAFRNLIYILTGLVFVIAATIFSIDNLNTRLNNPELFTFSLGSFEILITYPVATAFIAGLAGAIVLYHRTRFEGDERSFWSLRFVGIVILIIVFGILYASTDNVDGLLQPIPYSVGLVVILFPVQRMLN